ncbi:hypothetical protein DUNSADRAFT_13982 [Dunaliella salina]|uniref:Uncharacterized protein n=1 Tax=Dunaliella salina TaxID=3046 RepID=A0ABQ7G893_DUNSA|nr:hypothetical protein DUNSADRAFT_13982 [Dunaliella salina]|eukprot:KAF5830834.1 hypothetical protein DUNSADRAFT_13982 [Dunaliella salina]
MQDKLNVYEIDAVKDALRAAVEEEKAYLMEDIEYLTTLLTDEADMRAQAAVPPPPLSDLKEYCLKLQSAVADEEARHEHELRVSQMFAAAAADSSKAVRLRGMISASRRAQPQPLPQAQQQHHLQQHQQHQQPQLLPQTQQHQQQQQHQQHQQPHQFADGLMNGSRAAAPPVLQDTSAVSGADPSSSKPWAGAGEGLHGGQGLAQPQADVFVLEGSRGAAARGGGVGAAKRLANARGAVERTIPLLPPQPPPHSRAGSAGTDAKSTDRNKGGVPLGSATSDHRATLHPPSQEAVDKRRAVNPHSHQRSHRSHAHAGLGSPEQPGTGPTGEVGAACPTAVQGKASHGEGGTVHGLQSMRRSTSPGQGATTKREVAQEQQDVPPLQGSSTGGQGTHHPAWLDASPINGTPHLASHQHTNRPPGHCPPSLLQGHGSSAAGMHRSQGGHVRPSSAARLRALVANPPPLPSASQSSGSSNQGHVTQGHDVVGNGTASALCGTHRSRDSLQAEQSSEQGGATSIASQASKTEGLRGTSEHNSRSREQGSLEYNSNSCEQGSSELNSRSCEQDVACANSQGEDLDLKVDSLKGGVAAILRKHGLNPELTKSQTWRPQSAASLK